MLSTKLKPAVAALIATAGLLAFASPGMAAGAPVQGVTMLDHEGSPVVTHSAPRASLGREGSIEALRTPSSY